ncbi:tripartite motif-containing protein 3-like [Anneissia japonica]|uniref:tripartite motif-containing protein 3-like n=1 Tax=Anneissia japonica TaxID=1529436 RepID=UPI001425B14E|nr:tripartite motif-containing protein 3-like [Anneissia japonica]
MLNEIMENGDKLKNEVELIYKKKKEVIDVHMDELKTTISDINIKLSFLNHLLKSDEATAMQSSETVITALKDRINELPNSELKDNELIHVFINEDVYSILREWNIGYVKYKKDADCFELEGDKAYLQTPDFISVGIKNTDKCEINANQLKATWTMPTGETNIDHAVCDWEYRVTGKCTGPGIYKLDVTVYGKSIKQSPLIIKIEEEGLVNNIQINQELDIKNVVKCEDGSLLVSCMTNEILKYKQSGEYISKVTLPQGVSVNRMYKMENGNIAFSDVVNKCITICNMNGQVIKSIGQGVLKDPAGIHVDEVTLSNGVYVADWQNGCVFMFDIDSGQIIRNTGSQGNQEGQMSGVIDVTLTSEGNLLVLEYDNSRLQLFDNEGRFMEVLVEAGDENGELRNPSAVLVDEDDNIIISSQHKLQLFSSDGNFIKRIDDKEDGINPWGVSIISHNPQRVAAVNTDDKTIKIFNYTESLPNKFVLSFKMATSELNQFLENIDEKVLECTICFKRLQNPKSLNCLHSFCLSCLQDWVKAKGKLTCPTCSKSYSIPEGGLQKLPPNTFINNLLETIEQISETDQMKCVCGKTGAKYYCQDCRHYLCSTCSDHHQKFPMLHLVEDMQLMSPIQIALLHYPLCFLHKKPFKFFCCNIPICIQCTVTDHREREGKHKPISISYAFKTFKETSAELEKAAHQYKNKLQNGLKAVLLNATKLQQNKDRSLRDIDSHVQIMVKKIKENGDKMKKEVETIYKKKNKVLHDQTVELETTISDINTKLRFLNQLLKSDEAIAMQSAERVITALKDRINELQKTEPNDNAEIKYVINEKWNVSLQRDIGDILYMRAADGLTLKGEESATLDQKIAIKVIKTDECKIRKNQLTATWTQPTGETNITQVEEDDKGDYFVNEKCTSLGICKLNVHADGEPIKQSPMIIKVEKEGLVNTIDINKEYVRDVVMCEDDYLLVSNMTNEILKYQQSGEYIGTVALPQGVKVHRMFKMKNGNIAFSDYSKCIKICNMNGQVLKSIGQGVLKDPWGIHVDEVSNVVYVADLSIDWVYMFDIYSGQVIRKIGSHGYQKGQISEVIDVTLTNQGHLLVLEYGNNRLQLFDNEGRFMKVLVKKGYEDGKVRYACGVVVDENDNIIISNKHKLQLFSKDGNFIKRIDKESAGIQYAEGISISSHKPHRFAVANNGDKTVKIFNY